MDKLDYVVSELNRSMQEKEKKYFAKHKEITARRKKLYSVEYLKQNGEDITEYHDLEYLDQENEDLLKEINKIEYAILLISRTLRGDWKVPDPKGKNWKRLH